MSSINDAINNLNKAAFDATQTTDFYSKVADGGKTDVVTNPVSGVGVPSFQKMVNDIYTDQDVVAQAAASAASAEHFADVAKQESKKVDGVIEQVNNLQTIRTAIEWSANLTVDDALRLYSHNDNEYLPNKSLVPFNTSSTFDDNQFEKVGIASIRKMRTDSASQLGGVYKKDYETGDVIPADAMKNKLMYWHNGQFYSVCTNTGFTSNDFDADFMAGRFVSASSTTQMQQWRDVGDVRGWGVLCDYLLPDGSINPTSMDETVKIQSVIDFRSNLPGLSEVRIRGNCKISKLLVREGVLLNLGSGGLYSTLDEGEILRTESLSRSSSSIIGNRATIATISPSSTATCLWLDGGVFDRIDGLVFKNSQGYPVVIAGRETRDPTNFIIKNCESHTGRGLRIIAGKVGLVDYEEVTTGKVSDCFWTVTGDYEPSLQIECNPRSDGSFCSVFGITFDRVSFNSVAENKGVWLKLYANGNSSISHLRFENCEGETRGVNTNIDNPLIDLLGVTRSFFNFTTYSAKNNTYRLRNSSKNVFDSDVDSLSDLSDESLKFVRIDSLSYRNRFLNMGVNTSLISTELGYPLAPLSTKIMNGFEDNGIDNTFDGEITSTPVRLMRTNELEFITPSGQSFNPNFIDTGSTQNWTRVGGLNVTLTGNIKQGFAINLPSTIDPSNDNVTVRFKYRFASTEGVGSNWRVASSVGGEDRSPLMITATTWTDQVYMTKLTSPRLQIYSTTPVVADSVTIYISDLEIYKGWVVPYAPNLTPTDITTVFEENTYCTTPELPTDYSLYGSIFDTTTSSNKTFNGTEWV